MRFVQSPYHSSRYKHNVSLIVIHTTVGWYEGTINYFQNNDRRVSSHYVVKPDGTEVTQMVDEARASHHAGIVSNPNPKYVKKDSNGKIINPNYYSIGIENADKNQPHTWDRTGQHKALAILIRDICKRWNLPISRDYICGHRELYDKKTCPGNIDVDYVVKLAQEADFDMDDDTKRALDVLQQAKAEYGYGNLEGTARGLVGSLNDLVAVRNELKEYKDGEELRIKTAVEQAIAKCEDKWQSDLESANENIRELQQKVETLTIGLSTNVGWDTLIGIAIRKVNFMSRGGE